MQKIKFAAWSGYNKFYHSQTYKNLKGIKILQKTKQFGDQIKAKILPPRYRLHGDPYLQDSFKIAGNIIKASAIIETGTFLGNSTSLMAEQFPNAPIYTSEVFEKHYRLSTERLRKYPNVKVIKKSSVDFLKDLSDKGLFGKTPLFFLDAHWWNYWPLGDEMKIITNKIKSAVIVIDDFKVPNNPQFKYDIYKDIECSVDYIKPYMSKKNSYKILFPKYNHKDFPKDGWHPQLGGYCIIFQNLDKEYKEFISKDIIKKYFFDASKMLN